MAIPTWRNSLAPKGAPGPVLTLAQGGTTAYTIVIPASPTTQDRKAAEDLGLWLGQICGARFATQDDSQPPRDAEISVGRTNRLPAAMLGLDLGTEGYAVGVTGRRLLLAGGTRRGAINAVYAFLEEDLGCRWYDRWSSRLPEGRTLQVAPVPRSFVPPLFIRDPYYFDAFDATWSLRNRTNSPEARVPREWGGHVDYDGLFVHTYNTLVPPGQYWEQHPEYFMQAPDGRRTQQQVCQTHPEVRRIATASLLAILERHPDTQIVEVSPNDGGQHCCCPACQAIDDANGSPSGSLLDFVNHIAAAVEKVRPDVLVSTLAYLDTVDPPKLVRPRPNVVVRLCNDLHSWRYPFTCFTDDTGPESQRYRQAIVGWAAIGARLTIWDYFVNFSHYLAPMPNVDVLQPSLDFYLAHNVKGVMMQAAYQSLGGEFAPLRSWVMAKLLWEPALAVSELVDDFICGYYGPAAAQVKAYWDLCYATKARHPDSMDRPEGGIRYPMTSPFLSREFVVEGTHLLDGAEQACSQEQHQRRVALARLPLLYVKLMQGPQAWGDGYAAALQQFEQVARREQVTHLREGGPDLEEKLAEWKNALPADQVT